MNLPTRDALPIQSAVYPLNIDREKVQAFRKAFGSPSDSLPPTAYAILMKGMFELVERYQVEWKNVLHASQSFTYHQPITLPAEFRASSKLIDIKHRGGFAWLQFETIAESNSGESLVTAKSLLMIKEAA